MKSRSSLIFYINEKRHEVEGEKAFMNLSDYLRYEQSLTGTKVVCAEGDCGACTVLKASVHELEKGRFKFKTVNSCILPLFSLDASQIVTVEGLKKNSELHPVQTALVEKFGSQCGYCTPGFVCAMAGLVEDSILDGKKITEKRTKNYLTGNLCRCTGYDPIIKAALSIKLGDVETLQDRFHDTKKIKELQKLLKTPIEIKTGVQAVFLPTSLKQALSIMKKYPSTRIVAGATDLGVALNKGRIKYDYIMTLQNISELRKTFKKKNFLIVKSQVTLAEFQKTLEGHSTEMEKMLNLFASPQIKNSGTLVGNVVNASPISDTIPFLIVADALVEVQSASKKRLIPMVDFYLGYKKLNLKKGEIVTAIHLPLQSGNEYSKLYKVSLRKDLDISAVTMAARLKIKAGKIVEARLAFGGVGPIVSRVKQIENEWLGQVLTSELIYNAASKIAKLVHPISDVRGTKEYRLQLCKNLLRKMADELEAGL